MKKITTLFLAAAMLCGAASTQAVDFKAQGEWVMSFEGGAGGSLTEDGYGNAGEDNFSARQRVRLQLEAVASEALSGTVYFQIGDQTWGNAEEGGALGADGRMVNVKQAYVDWLVPNTDLKLRMGLQGVSLPSFAGQQFSFDEDHSTAGIVASYKFTENVALTGMWLRLYNDNFTDTRADGRSGSNAHAQDNVDLFGLVLPLTFTGVNVTPWVVYGAVGQNYALDGNEDLHPGNLGFLMRPEAGSARADRLAADKHTLNAYSDLLLAGLTGEITVADPFRFAWDVQYSKLATGEERYNQQGWFATLLAEYKVEWGTPGLYVWYASGEDDSLSNGSERMVSFGAQGGNEYAKFAFDGQDYIARGAVLGDTMSGTWGVGARLADMHFVENLKHSLRVNYIAGTNEKEGLEKLALTERKYLTKEESALEVGLSTEYQVYENLVINSDIAYLALFGEDYAFRKKAGEGDKADAWNANVSFVYSF